MAPFSNISILLISIILLFSVANATIDDTCKAANASIGQGEEYSFYDFCTSTLRADPRSETANAHELGLIGAQLCLTNATNTRAKIGDMIRNGNVSRKARECLRRCAGKVYRPEIKHLARAVKSCKSGNYGDALDEVVKVGTTANDCGHIFFDGRVPDMVADDEYNLRMLTLLAAFLIEPLSGK